LNLVVQRNRPCGTRVPHAILHLDNHAHCAPRRCVARTSVDLLDNPVN
jgi:hypothetical protein